MGHCVQIRDVVTVIREVELPDFCPRCKIPFRPGDRATCVTAIHVVEKLRLIKTLTDEGMKDGFEVRGIANKAELGEHLRRSYRCANCNYTLQASLMRSYVLTEMDKNMLGKLRGLLYDENIPDQSIKKLCYPELMTEAKDELDEKR